LPENRSRWGRSVPTPRSARSPSVRARERCAKGSVDEFEQPPVRERLRAHPLGVDSQGAIAAERLDELPNPCVRGGSSPPEALRCGKIYSLGGAHELDR